MHCGVHVGVLRVLWGSWGHYGTIIGVLGALWDHHGGRGFAVGVLGALWGRSGGLGGDREGVPGHRPFKTARALRARDQWEERAKRKGAWLERRSCALKGKRHCSALGGVGGGPGLKAGEGALAEGHR